MQSVAVRLLLVDILVAPAFKSSGYQTIGAYSEDGLGMGKAAMNRLSK